MAKEYLLQSNGSSGKYIQCRWSWRKSCRRHWLWGFILVPKEGGISSTTCTSQAGKDFWLYHFWGYFCFFCYFWLASAVVVTEGTPIVTELLRGWCKDGSPSLHCYWLQAFIQRGWWNPPANQIKSSLYTGNPVLKGVSVTQCVWWVSHVIPATESWVLSFFLIFYCS